MQSSSRKLFSTVSKAVRPMLLKPSQSLTVQGIKSMSTISLNSKLNINSLSVQKRSFSSNNKEANADGNLSQILAEELLQEKDRVADEVDEDYDDVKKYISSIFEITERVGYGEVKLFRKYKDEEITITFDCQDESDPNEDRDESDDINNAEGQQHSVNEEDADQIGHKFGYNFQVSIEKKSGSAVFYCVANHLQPTIVNVMFLAKDIADTESYGGPRFEDLDPAVQGGFHQYLAERGIDEDLSFFILSHARVKEEAEYMNWLEKLNEFVN